MKFISIAKILLIGLSSIFLWTCLAVADATECPCWSETELNAGVDALLNDGFYIHYCFDHPYGIPSSVYVDPEYRDASVGGGVISLLRGAGEHAHVTAAIRCTSINCENEDVLSRCTYTNFLGHTGTYDSGNIEIKEAIVCAKQIKELCKSLP